jgi:hypothetical protein
MPCPTGILQELRRWIEQQEAEPTSERQPIEPGDLVQIKPAADKIFGGMIMRVTRVRPDRIEGYLLRPHRSGWREAWHHHTAPELVHIGRVIHAEPEWGFRGEPQFAIGAGATDTTKIPTVEQVRRVQRAASNKP